MKRRNTTHSPSRRYGFIDPREHDNPPFASGHPFSVPMQDHRPGTASTPIKLHHKQGRQPRPRRQSEPQSSRQHPTFDSTQHVNILALRANRLDGPLPPPPCLDPVSWPFLRSENAPIRRGAESVAEEFDVAIEASRSGAALGPLGALIAELRLRRGTGGSVRSPEGERVEHDGLPGWTGLWSEETGFQMRRVLVKWVKKHGRNLPRRKTRSVREGRGRIVAEWI